MRLLKKSILHISLFSIALTSMHSSFAQSEWKASVGAQVSLTELSIDNATPEISDELGLGLNLGISYALNDNWSLHSGIGISSFNTNTSLSNYSDRIDAIDLEGEAFEFRYSLNNYTEDINSTLFSIPIAVQYETNDDQIRFYGKAGASINIFINPTSEGSANNLTTSGFFESSNAELTAPRFAGFGTFESIDFNENDIEINNSINASLEVGVKSKTGDNHWVYIGLFAEYGVNDLLEDTNSSLIDYNTNTPLDFINNGSLNTSVQSSGSSFFDEISLNIIGLRIRYEIGL